MQAHKKIVRSRQAGFTLLEMMAALAILALALVGLIDATTRAIRAENHAKMVTAATQLARMRLVELEDEIADKGFTDDSLSTPKCDTFEDKGFKRFKGCVLIDKVTLPNTDQVQNMVSKALEAKQQLGGGDSQAAAAASSSSSSAGGGAGGPMGAGAGFLSSQFGIVKDVLEQGIRRANVRVLWDEMGREQSVEIYEYLTDPRRVDQSIQMPMLGGAGGPTGGTGGTNTMTTQPPAGAGGH
jgi:general secretion pathway protein I